MCPIIEEDKKVTEEVKEEAIIKKLILEEEDSFEEVGEEHLVEEVSSEEKDSEEAEFEGVDKLEDIPEGKEKDYGI